MAIHQLRVEHFEALVVDLEFACGRQPHVVVNNIGPTGQRFYGGLGLLIAQLQRYPQLATLGAAENPLQAAHGIAFGRFDFNDFGAEVRQKHASKRPGQVGAQIQYFQTVQRRQGRRARPGHLRRDHSIGA